MALDKALIAKYITMGNDDLRHLAKKSVAECNAAAEAKTDDEIEPLELATSIAAKWYNPGDYIVKPEIYNMMTERMTIVSPPMKQRPRFDPILSVTASALRASLDLSRDTTEVEEEPEPKPEPELGKKQYDSRHYSESMFTYPKRIIEEYTHALDRNDLPEHDTLVGTGLSGSIAVALLANAADKMYAVVRKEGVSHHGTDIEGCIGAKWLFVDDFVSRGTTRRRVLEKMGELVKARDLDTTFVGSWLYSRSEFQGPESF